MAKIWRWHQNVKASKINNQIISEMGEMANERQIIETMKISKKSVESVEISMAMAWRKAAEAYQWRK
jgi:hypothetical protein